MIVSRARIKYYRSIIDTGWVDLETDITTLLGKNESGKSSFLQALESVSNEDPIDERDQNYNQDPDEVPFEVVRVELVPEDRSDVIEFGNIKLDVPLYIVKLSDGTRRIESSSGEHPAPADEIKKKIIDVVTSIDDAVGGLEDGSSNELRNEYQSELKNYVDNIQNKGEINDLQWVLNQLENLINKIDKFSANINLVSNILSVDDIESTLSQLYTETRLA
jgi:predicted ATP-dependent endonuclease of OLD family